MLVNHAILNIAILTIVLSVAMPPRHENCIDLNNIFRDGSIVDFGDDDVIETRYSTTPFDKVVDVSGMSIIPGLIDAHTHPVWDGDRVHEFAMKVIYCLLIFIQKGKNVYYPNNQQFSV